MLKRLLIIGAKGFAKELTELVLQLNPNTSITYFDDISNDLPEKLFGQYPIIRTENQVTEHFRSSGTAFALGVGSPKLRKRFYERFAGLGGKAMTLISPFAKIGSFANQLEEGCCVLTDAIIESTCRIGKGTLIHVGTLVSHDVTIGKFCEISPRANLLGNVTIGDFCRVGTGAIVLPNVRIADGVVIGAGGVVTSDVAEYTTVVGVPAKPILR